jgi:hypothetical protein
MSFGSMLFQIVVKFHISFTFRKGQRFRESGAIAPDRVFTSNGVIYQVATILPPTYWIIANGGDVTRSERRLSRGPNGVGTKEDLT